MTKNKRKNIVVITGAASGIGFSLVKQYLDTGDRVVGIDLKPQVLQEYKESLGIKDRDLLIYQADVRSEDSLREIATDILEQWGRPHIWYNNAGLAFLGKFQEITKEDFQLVIDVNFFGVVHGTRVALEVMDSGKVVNMASMNAKIAAPWMSSYVASKHAVAGFTRSIREEMDLAHRKIDLILVTPGFVNTKIIQGRDEEGVELPEWFFKMAEDPSEVAKEIFKAVAKGQREIVPTMNAKIMEQLNRVTPGLVRKSSRIFVAKNWKELMGIEPIE